jgi:FAD-dependent urate hydroxylase
MTQPRTALVIGGGIAGPVAAMALQRAGIQATVYEAHPRSAEGIGIFLTLASNGIDALRTIDADRPALAAGFPTPGILLRSTTGKDLGVARTALSLADSTTSHTMKRGRPLPGDPRRGVRPRHRGRARRTPNRHRTGR